MRLRMRSLIRSTGALLLVASTLDPALAQANGPPAPPHVDMIDENFVNLASGVTTISIPIISLGSGDLGLSLVGYFDSGAWLTGTSLTALYEYDRSGNERVSFGRNGDARNRNGSNNLRNGGLLVVNSDGSRTVYLRDGARLEFANNTMHANRIVWPTGKEITLNGMLIRTNAASVFQNNGILLKQHADGSMVIVNTAYEYCNPDPNVKCVLSQTWPVARQFEQVKNNTAAPAYKDVKNIVIDQAGGRFELEAIQGMLTQYLDKSSSKVPRIYERCTAQPVNCYYTTSSVGVGSARTTQMTDRVISARRNGDSWSFNYTWKIGPYGSMYTGTGPSGNKQIMQQSPVDGFSYISSYKDDKASYNFDYLNRVTFSSSIGRGSQNYFYDTRSNLTKIEYVPREGSDEARNNILLSATLGFDESCSYIAKCNKANFFIDQNKNRTEYEYDQVTGQILRETKPAVAGYQPVVRYAYAPRKAWYLGPSGAFIQSPTAISLLVSQKTCRTGPTIGDSCAIASDEVVTTYDYGPDSGPNNLWLRGVKVTADGVSLLTCYDYDRLGNRIKETLPSAGRQSCY